jgi:hypothetical protein
VSNIERVSVAVFVGRNVGLKAMTDGEWGAFRGLVLSTLARYGSVFVDPTRLVGRNAGIWGTIREDSAAGGAMVPRDKLGALRADLTRLAARYGQDGVGYFEGGEVI